MLLAYYIKKWENVFYYTFSCYYIISSLIWFGIKSTGLCETLPIFENNINNIQSPTWVTCIPTCVKCECAIGKWYNCCELVTLYVNIRVLSLSMYVGLLDLPWVLMPQCWTQTSSKTHVPVSSI